MCKPFSATNATTQQQQQQQMLVRTDAVSNEKLIQLGLDPAQTTCVELPAGNEIYSLVCAHLVKSEAARSFTLDISSGVTARVGCCDSDRSDSSEGEDDLVRVADKGLGLGVISFTFEGQALFALHQTLGEVVGTNCGPALYKSLVLLGSGAGAVDAITRFCDALIAKADATSTSTFSIFRWHVQYSYWRKAEVTKARPIESVVLPEALKSKFVDDVSEFVSPATKAWYGEHGVPYKRSYLLHGSPGAGKTSIIQAIAGKFKRNVCYFSSLSHPDMNDDALKSAVQKVPAKSLIVLEDIDALFSESDGRQKKAGDRSALTFSGVLNALDGVGSSTGQIFILTTNHRERLDPALIRCGRVDCHVEFSDASPEQMRLLFAQFYKSAPPALAEKFADGLCALLGDETVSMAALQHYFTQMRRASAEEAAAQVKLVIEEAKAHGHGLKAAAADKEEAKAEEAKAEEAKGGMADADATKGDDEAAEQEEEEEEKPPAKGGKRGKEAKEIHVHVHLVETSKGFEPASSSPDAKAVKGKKATKGAKAVDLS